LNGKSCTHGEVDFVAESEERRGGRRSVLRIGAAGARSPERDAATGPCRVDSGSEALDDAGGLIARNPRERRRIVDPSAALGIREVHTNGVKADENLAGAGFRHRMRSEDQNIGAAQGVNDDGLHRALRDFERRLDLDGDVVGQSADPDRHPGMPAGFPEDGDEDVRRAVDDLGLTREVRGGVHVARDPNASNDSIQIAGERLSKMSDEVQGAEASRLLPLRNAELSSEFSDEASFTVPLRELAGDEKKVARSHGRDVIRTRRARCRQLDSELAETLVNPGHRILGRAS
jgi:hypothetical protein